MARMRPVVILGAGPVGLVAALQARRLGHDVEVLTDRLPSSEHRPHIECVPTQVIALLIDFGVPPARLGVDRVLRTRCLQWDAAAATIDALPYVSVSRPNLEASIALLAEAAGIRITHRTVSRACIQEIDPDFTVFDATGRRAVTAERHWRSIQPIVARSFQFAEVKPAREGFELAAGPNGYVYRLANRNGICLGVVGRNQKGTWAEVCDRITRFAPWIVSDLCDRDFTVVDGKSGPCSLQWAQPGSRALLIGDAFLGRDAISSQGLATGFGTAISAVSQELTGSLSGRPVDLAIQRTVHAKRVIDQIGAAPFSRHNTWRQYGDFLGRAAMVDLAG